MCFYLLATRVSLLLIGESDFERMLETWFPQGGHPPSAFLVDTSEEALLLPDWLKLRMIRCSIERLIDAGKLSFFLVSEAHLILVT